MSQRIVIDPITRIRGHLRIEAQMDGATVQDAYASGTMVRGIETILRGRDPREAWALAQRIDGSSFVHGLASVRAVEHAFQCPAPPNAELIRNLMLAAQYAVDHVMHFYWVQAPDWADPVAAFGADPRKSSELAQGLSRYANTSPGYFDTARAKLQALSVSGPSVLFNGGYWGHPAYRSPPEANLMIWTHALDAMAWQREVAQLQAIFGGKNPHPNLVIGGMPCAISLESDGQAGTALDIAGLERVRSLLKPLRDFVEQVYLPDTLAMAGFYKDWLTRGEGIGNFMCYGDFPSHGFGSREGSLIPGGVILKRDLRHVHAVDLEAEDEIQEFVVRSWYDYADGKEHGLHPYRGESTLDYTGPEPPYRELDLDRPYSWLKSPRWRGQPVEVGPLARLLMLHATGNARASELIDVARRKLDVPFEALYSSMGRTLARAIEAQLVVEAMDGWYDQLLANIRAGDLATFNPARWSPASWPRTARGVGHVEAPCGALGHWVVIEDGRTTNYQAVAPCGWNAGPRDARNQPGPCEAALGGQALEDPSRPIELLRALHSFGQSISAE